MSMIARLAIVAVLAATALAQSCNMNVTLANPYVRSNCTGYGMCEQSLCMCSGVSYSANRTADTCVAGSTLGCESFTACMKGFFSCLDDLTSARTNASDPCFGWAVSLHTALLETAVASYNGSKIQEYCGISACHLRNASSKNSCAMGTNFSAVCTQRLVKQRVAQGTLRLGGGNWSVCMTNATCRESISIGIAKDLAALLGIPTALLEILSVRVGSLIVDFAILEGSNKTAESLVATILAAGNSTSWLTAVKALYATVSSEPLTVEGFSAVTVTTTLAGTTNAPSWMSDPYCFLCSDSRTWCCASGSDAASPVPVLAAFAVAAFALLL
jgi:hypothetical protein